MQLSLSITYNNINYITFTVNGSNGTLQDFNPESIELDYQRTMYGSVNTTLAWVNTAGDCSINQVLSYPRCQPNNADINVTTSDTEVTVPSESLWISGDLADFKISSSSDQQSAELDTDCPDFLETIRINGEP